MSSNYRILFVCMGNICRSPAGECVLRHIAADDTRIECDSAGTIGYHAGDAPDRRMTAAAAKRGIKLTGRARQIQATDLDSFDLILTMDEENYLNVRSLATCEQQSRKIRRFCEFCQDHDETEVPDPYYGGGAGFERVLDLLEDGCQHILEFARKELAQTS